MSNTATITLRDQPTMPGRNEEHYRQLCANASACAQYNVEIRVDSFNTDRTIAICTVRQRHRGFLRRTYSRDELLLRAEQALAPLLRLGIMPMINMPDAKADYPTARTPAQRTFDRFRLWIGYPQEGPGPRTSPVDPFGLFAALRRATSGPQPVQPSCANLSGSACATAA